MATPFGYTGNLTAAKRIAGVASTRAGSIGMAARNGAMNVASAVSSGLALTGDAARYGFSDPSRGGTQRPLTRGAQYAMGWMSYTNEVFEQITFNRGAQSQPFGFYGAGAGYYSGVPRAWPTYLHQRGLYARTMSLYNPTRRLVDFYASHVFPGVLSEDGSVLPDGMALAIPLSRDTDPKLKEAIAQGWYWGNWQKQKSIWIRFCAATGDGPVEIIDDVEAGNVYAEPCWPGEIVHVEFSGRGNVSAYVRAHRVVDETGEYVLTREVNADTIRTYKDGALFGVGEMPAEYDNPYGFAPLVWNSHVDFKTIPGGTAIRNWNKIEKLNSLASRLHRYIERRARTPVVLPKGQSIQMAKIDATAEEELQILTIDGEGGIEEFPSNLALADTEVRLASMIQEIEHDHPEVVMYQALRGMSQVTGPAAEQLMGDVAGYLNDARAGYDQAEIRKNGMLVAIGGMRYAEGKGGWAARNSQQKKFAPFGLDSYARGDLEHSIDPRPLMTPSREQVAQTKMSVMAAYAAGFNADQPLDFQIGEFGEDWSPEQIAALKKAQAEDHSQNVQRQQEMTDAQAPPVDESKTDNSL